MDQNQLRSLVARVQDQVTLVGTPAASDGDRLALTEAWDALVQHLAVAAPAEVRSCPHCAHEIMRAATLCGYCWTRSTADRARA